MRIVLIGSGNVATVLGRKLFRGGHQIAQVFSRRSDHAGALAHELGADAISSADEVARDADVYVFAIPDDELYRLDKWDLFAGNVAVHTAGSVSREVLHAVSENYGVLYPLQTLRKEVDLLNELPLLVDGNSEETKRKIFQLAASISSAVQYADDEERRKLHVAAVMANNFSNHLFTLVEAFCKREGVDFKLLFPLIAEGVGRLSYYAPAQLQTGPAIRHDLITIAHHKALLADYPALLKIYEFFTDSIMKK